MASIFFFSITTFRTTVESLRLSDVKLSSFEFLATWIGAFQHLRVDSKQLLTQAIWACFSLLLKVLEILWKNTFFLAFRAGVGP